MSIPWEIPSAAEAIGLGDLVAREVAQRRPPLWELLENASDAVIAVDSAGSVVRANQAAVRLFGLTGGVGERVTSLFVEDEALRQVLMGGTGTRAHLRLTGAPGDGLCEVSVSPGSSEWPSYWLVSCSRLASAQDAKIYFRATRDHLTGLYNRSVFQEELERRVGETLRAGDSGALLWMDLDRFKQVNDRLGHGAGDLMLTMVAAFLQASVRRNELLARVGGDEFALMIPAGDEDTAVSAAVRILREFERGRFAIDGESMDIGISIGVVVYPRHGDNVPDLMTHADEAMYRAKTEGLGYAVYRETAAKDRQAR